jgi:hypothetical protein
LFLRSNGTLACWDDFGSLLTLQPFDPSLDYAADVYLGPVFGAIRDRLRRGQMPFPEHCSRCYCLRHDAAFDERYVDQRIIETFQIEPSMGCQLDCPGCIPIRARRQRVASTPHGHLTLASHVVDKIVTDLHRAGVAIHKFDFQGHGEPLLNARTWEMARRVADLYPGAVVSICTNANFEFRPHMIRSGVNEILFAIDGLDAPSYEPYRVNGDFDVAYKFMKDFSCAAARDNPSINRVWKYVVFAHNDRPDQLLRAQELALEAKVTELRFVLTQLGPLSSDVMHESHVPRLDPSLNVTFENYRVASSQVTAALDELRSAIATESADRTTHLAQFIVNMLHRLFRTASSIPSEYAGVIDRFLELRPELPPDLGRDCQERLDELLRGVLARRPTVEQLRLRQEQLETALKSVVANNNRLAQRLTILSAPRSSGTGSVPPSRALFCLDRPRLADRGGPIEVSDRLTVGGWLIPASGNVVVSLDICTRDELVARATLNQMRPDVERAHPGRPRARWSGFSAEVPLARWAGTTVELYLVASYCERKEVVSGFSVRVRGELA